MSSLRGMPEDVVRAILPGLRTRDASVLSGTSKALRALAVPCLYGAIKWPVTKPKYFPLNLLLRTLRENPRSAMHVTCLSLEGPKSRPQYWQEVSPTTLWSREEGPRLSSEDLQLIEGLVDAAQLSPESLWKEHVNSGSVDVYTALILALLSNLGKLALSFDYHSGTGLCDSLFEGILPSSPRSEHSTTFASLRQVKLSASEYDKIDNRVVTSFFYLPSIQTTDAQLSYQKTFCWPCPTPPNAATLITLCLRGCQPDEDHLARLLSATPSLQTLVCKTRDNVDGPGVFRRRSSAIDLTKLTYAIRQLRRTLGRLSLSITFWASTALDTDSNEYG